MDEAGLWENIKPILPNVRTRKVHAMQVQGSLSEEQGSITKKCKGKKKKKGTTLKSKLIRTWHPDTKGGKLEAKKGQDSQKE